MIGQKIDRYDVVERLGQGGMGVVYKARDTLLDRYVALKVLPPEKSSDPERRQRFLGEAKAASALNHPGIVSVYDIVTVDGQDVIVMELVEGETLEQRLSRKRLPLTEALGLGGQIADALGRAHAAGIVHRDLKPANVMLTAEGGVKILDFGLAKLTQAPFMDDEAETLSHHALTAEHVVAGTIGWMSPEQATGQAVDARSDVFSFGLVLYEMLTGQHPFKRRTTTETLAAIREDEPEPPSRLNPAVPVEAERAVLRCLRKDPGRRWQSVSDLSAVLADIREDSLSGRGLPPVPRRRRPVRWGLVAGVGALVVAVAGVGAFLLLRTPPPSAPLDLTRLTYDSGLSWMPSISPDGNLVAYSSDRGGKGDLDIWVRQIHQPEPVRLTRNPAHEWAPRFSPDGSKVVYRSERDGGGIYVVGALGGPERRIAPSGFFPAFTPDGADVTYTEDPDRAPDPLLRMFRVPAEGGAPEPFAPGFGLLSPPHGGAGPVWSPDGRLALFPGAPMDDRRKSDWWVVPLADGEPRSSGAMTELPKIDGVQFPSAWRPGRLLLLAGSTLEGMTLYEGHISDEGRISGPARPLTAGPGMAWSASVSADGRLTISRFQWVVPLWEQKLDAESGEATGPPRRLTADAAPKFGFSLTRDGRRLAFSVYSGPPGERQAEIRVRDEGGEEMVPVSRPSMAVTFFPCLSADGAFFAWAEPVAGREWVSFVAPTGESAGREVCRSCRPVAFLDGTHELLVDRHNGLSRVRLDDGTATPVIELKDRPLVATSLSPDDRWIAALMGEPKGGRMLRILPVASPPASPEEWTVVAGGEEWVGPSAWSPDGRILYYLSDRDDFVCVWARRVDPGAGKPEGDPFAVVHAHTTAMSMQLQIRSAFSLAVGGDRLVFNAGESTGNIYTALLPNAR